MASICLGLNELINEAQPTQTNLEIGQWLTEKPRHKDRHFTGGIHLQFLE